MEARIVHLASGDLWAGAEVQLFQLVTEYVKYNENLLVVLFNPGQLADLLTQNNIEVIVLDETELSSLVIARQLYLILKKFKATIIHTHRFKENILGGLVAKLFGCKSVRTEHGASEFLNLSFDLRRFVSHVLDRFSGLFLQQKIIAVSDELKGKLSKNYPDTKIQVIENSVQFELIRQNATQSKPIDKSSKDFIVGFIGRFVPVKRTDFFYDIAKNTLVANPELNIHFYMIGDGPLIESMQQQVESEGFYDRVHLPGFKSNTATYLKQFDLLLFTSDHEGLPMTLLEAMSLNIPVMSTNLATVKKVLCDGDCGYIMESRNPDEFSSKILEILNNPQESLDMAAKASKVLETRYSIENNIQLYQSVYDEILLTN